MSTVVHSITASQDNLNDGAMEETINDLIAQKYFAPEWKRQGPNWIHNSATGADVNLNAEATAILLDAPLRQDVVVVTRDDAGARQVIHVPESVVQKVGGDLDTLRKNLDVALNAGAMTTATKVMIGLAVVGVGVVIWKSNA